jgi:hypothetical protein
MRFMSGLNAGQLVLQAGLSFAFCLLLWLAGGLVTVFAGLPEEEDKNEYSSIFYRMLLGIIGIVVVYSIYKTSFKTINILIALAACLCIRRKKTGARPSLMPRKIHWGRAAEVFLLCGIFCLLFNLLPESEYKQKDSFFYLKIAEALNRTGQENLHHYYNTLDGRYHGVEAYHYMELWLNAFLLNFTAKLLPDIQTFRVITYTLLSVTFITGLFHFYRVVTGNRPGLTGKLVCFSFIFFIPDLYPYFPAAVNKWLLFNFENNFLERPNFRVVYLFLLPVLTGIFRRRIDRFFLFFLLCLCLVHPLIYAVVVPLVLLSFILYRLSGSFRREMVLPGKELFVFLLIAALYPLFYLLFSPKAVPVLYHTDIASVAHFYKRSYKYVALTIATSLLYTGFLCGLGWLIFRALAVKAKRNFLKENKPFVVFVLLTVICAIIIARAFDFMENAYQVAYIGYIIASLFIFSLLALLSKQGALPALLVIFLFTGGYVLSKYRDRQTAFVNVFLQNGTTCYRGRPYSAVYLEQVMNYMKTADGAAGLYMADSGYYRDLYYSLHNPVVYHLPVTYIIANNVSSNIDYGVSDTSAIYCGTGEVVRNTYLINGLARSFFHNGFMPGSDSLNFQDRLRRFIDSYNMRYMILTRGVYIDTSLSGRIDRDITDANTGERFLILKPLAQTNY